MVKTLESGIRFSQIVLLLLAISLYCAGAYAGNASAPDSGDDLPLKVSTTSFSRKYSSAGAVAPPKAVAGTTTGGGITRASIAAFIPQIPQTLVAIVVGTAVGTPIALVRFIPIDIVRESKRAYELGDVGKPLGYATAVICGLPSGLLNAGVDGLADGLVDSIANSSKEKRFSKAAFSLGKLHWLPWGYRGHEAMKY